MPYIKIEDRVVVDSEIEALAKKVVGFPEDKQDGVMNYVITKLCKEVYTKPKKSYFKFNRLIGMLTACKDEIYRRLVGPYEDEKIKENGDV